MKINRSFCLFAVTALGASHADGPELKAVQHPMSELRAIAKFSIPGSPDWVAIGDSVWISNKPKNNISQLDAKTNQVGAVIAVAKDPCSGLAIAFDSVWVPICSDGSVERVDARSGKIVATISSGVANTEGGITAGEGSIWMPSDAAGVLSRIDPATNKVVSKISIPAGSFTAVFDAGSVWITSTKNNLLTRVDAKTEKVLATDSGGAYAAIPGRWIRQHLDAQPGRRQRVAHRSGDQQSSRRPLKSACRARAAISLSAKVRFG